MRSCVITGAGRSGTSLVTGMFRRTGHYLGSSLLPDTSSNPAGYFEDRDINDINEQLISLALPLRWRAVLRLKPKANSAMARRLPVVGQQTTYSQRWLPLAPLKSSPVASDDLARRIMDQVSREPFCFKDPRFTQTLPAWRPFLPRDVAYVCVFRDPSTTVTSMLRDAEISPYLADLRLTEANAYRAWENSYRSVLVHSRRDDWLFVHYDQVMDGSAVPRLERHVGASLDASFAQQALRRSSPRDEAPASALDLYRELQARSR